MVTVGVPTPALLYLITLDSVAVTMATSWIATVELVEILTSVLTPIHAVRCVTTSKERTLAPVSRGSSNQGTMAALVNLSLDLLRSSYLPSLT